MTATRREEDSFGAVEVPAGSLWGAQTQRSLQHFSISDERLPAALIAALGMAKAACARVNGALGRLPPEKAAAIAAAAEEIAAGDHADEFPLRVWQTGSGTQTNMNVNEVIANRASQLLGGALGSARCVHANDDVNLGQSSNDVFPTAMHVAAALAIHRAGSAAAGPRPPVLPTVQALQAALAGKAAAFASIVKVGRTHLQDATPLTLGQEFSGYAAQLEQAGAQIAANLPLLYPLAIGGTAVGTGVNTHPEFGDRVAADLKAQTGIPFTSAANKFAALAAHDALVSAHGALKTLAVALNKIANDLRWLASGPRSGLGEIILPANEPGSSIMPGKVNPTQCEAMTMLCVQVIANDVAIGIAGASGNFELNVYKPLIAHAFLQSTRLLADGMDGFTRHCVLGIAANRERIDELMQHSLMLVTALVPYIGYDKAAEIAHRAQGDGSTLRAAAIALGHVSGEDYDRWVVPAAMTGPITDK